MLLTFKGTPAEQLDNFKNAFAELDKTAADNRASIDQFKAYEQEKIKDNKPEQAKQFAASAAQLECKQLAYVEALRIIKKHVAV